MREVRIALAAGLTLLAVAVVVVLARSPTSVAHTNGTPKEEERIAYTTRPTTYCQGGETLPAHTSAIRLWMLAYIGPSVRVTVYAGGHAVTGGRRGSGWTSREVTVPVRPLAHAVADATVCTSFSLRDESITVFGRATGPAIAAREGGKALPGRMWIEYLRPGASSWASMVPSILSHMGFDRAPSGPGLVLLALALAVAVLALSSRLVLRELG